MAYNFVVIIYNKISVFAKLIADLFIYNLPDSSGLKIFPTKLKLFN
jgi:hypothetical protein